MDLYYFFAGFFGVIVLYILGIIALVLIARAFIRMLFKDIFWNNPDNNKFGLPKIEATATDNSIVLLKFYEDQKKPL